MTASHPSILCCLRYLLCKCISVFRIERQSNWLRKPRALTTAGLPALKQSTPSKGRSINLERKVNPQEEAE
jgi:hypothetical protein